MAFSFADTWQSLCRNVASRPASHMPHSEQRKRRRDDDSEEDSMDERQRRAKVMLMIL